MAGYTITVNFQDAGSGDASEKGYKSPKQLEAERQKDYNKQFFGEQDSNFDFVDKGIEAMSSLVVATSIASIGQTMFQHEIQRIGRYTGSQQAQDVANATLSLVGMVTRPISSIINTAYELEQTDYERQWESIGLQLYRERGGVSLNRSRSER